MPVEWITLATPFQLPPKPSASMAVKKKPVVKRGRPKSDDVAAIEQKLLTVALHEFIEHGYGATSLNQIIRATGMSKTTLYARYASKEDLFRAIIREQVLQGHGALLFRPSGSRLNIREGLEAYANRMLEISLEGDLLKVNRLIHSESSRFPELGTAASDRTKMGIAQVAEFIRECAASDQAVCRDPDAGAEAFIFMIRGWYVDVMLTNRKVSAAQRQEWVRRTVNTLISSWSSW